MDTLVEFVVWLVDVALWSAIWYALFKALETLLGIIKIKQESDDIRVDLEQKLETVLHNVKQEKHDDISYWFDDDNDEFLAQGRTTEDVIAHLRSRFKDHIFVINDQHVLVGPEYDIVDLGKDDPTAAGKYIAKVLLKRVGVDLVDK